MNRKKEGLKVGGSGLELAGLHARTNRQQPTVNRFVRTVLLVLLASALSACSEHGPSAEHVLTYASPYPPTHPFSRADITWMKFVEERSAGRLRIKPFWGGALLSSDQSMIEIRHGVADIGLITPIYTRGGVHASRAQAGFYSGVQNMEDQIAIFKCLEHQFPVFSQELKGLHILALQGGNFPGLLTRSRPIRTLADLQGLRLRAQSDSIDVLRTLGADPVNMPMNEVYSALAKGVIDGVVAPADALRSMHFAEVGAHYTEIRFSRGSYPARAISDKAWRRLPADLQRLLTDSRGVWEQALTQEIERASMAGFKFAREHKLEIIAFPVEEQRRFDELYVRSALDQARQLRKFDIDGEPIFRETQRLIRERAAGRALNCEAPTGRAAMEDGV
jgi:TRAP-type C4-dicarboxylate transport system substrate-binding protein